MRQYINIMTEGDDQLAEQLAEKFNATHAAIGVGIASAVSGMGHMGTHPKTDDQQQVQSAVVHAKAGHIGDWSVIRFPTDATGTIVAKLDGTTYHITRGFSGDNTPDVKMKSNDTSTTIYWPDGPFDGSVSVNDGQTGYVVRAI